MYYMPLHADHDANAGGNNFKFIGPRGKILVRLSCTIRVTMAPGPLRLGRELPWRYTSPEIWYENLISHNRISRIWDIRLWLSWWAKTMTSKLGTLAVPSGTLPNPISGHNFPISVYPDIEPDIGYDIQVAGTRYRVCPDIIMMIGIPDIGTYPI